MSAGAPRRPPSIGWSSRVCSPSAPSFRKWAAVPAGKDGAVWDATKKLLNVYVASRAVDGTVRISTSSTGTGTGGATGAARVAAGALAVVVRGTATRVQMVARSPPAATAAAACLAGPAAAPAAGRAAAARRRPQGLAETARAAAAIWAWRPVRPGCRRSRACSAWRSPAWRRDGVARCAGGSHHPPSAPSALAGGRGRHLERRPAWGVISHAARVLRPRQDDPVDARQAGRGAGPAQAHPRARAQQLNAVQRRVTSRHRTGSRIV